MFQPTAKPSPRPAAVALTTAAWGQVTQCYLPCSRCSGTRSRQVTQCYLASSGHPGDRLRGEPVESRDRQLEVLGLRVLELGVRETAQALDEEHHRRDPGPRDLGGVVERAARKPVRIAGDLAERLVRQRDQLLVEQDRLDVPDPVPRDVEPLLLGEPLRGV